MTDHIDTQAFNERQAQYAEPMESFKAPGISEFLDLCIEHLPDDMIEELRYHQERYDTIRSRFSEIKAELKAASQESESGVYGVIYNKLRNL